VHDEAPAPEASITPLIKPVRPVLVHAPDPLAEPVARLEAEMALSAVIVAAELRTPRPAAAAVMAQPIEEPPPAVAAMFPIKVESSLLLDGFAAEPAAAENPPAPDESTSLAEAPPLVEAPPVIDEPRVTEELPTAEYVPATRPAPAPHRRRATAWMLGAVAAFGLVLCIVLLAVGSQAPAADARYPMRNVVGMQSDEAQAMLAQDGVQISTVRANHGPVGVVLKESGFDADGTYGPGSEIVLLVGGGR
jgi:hypothetical protein